MLPFWYELLQHDFIFYHALFHVELSNNFDENQS